MLARRTGVSIRRKEFKPIKPYPPKYKLIFQMMVLKYKYVQIEALTGYSPEAICLIVKRNEPHLLYGRGNNKRKMGRPLVDLPISEIAKIKNGSKSHVLKEKYWNPKTMKYE